MGMVAISREDYPNAAGSHAGSENIDEWLKKKYAIQQQEADANTMLADARRIEADSLAKQRNWEWNPDLESSKGVGGYRFLDLARQKNLDASVIARNKAGTSKIGEEAEGLARQNKLESELYGDIADTRRSQMANTRAESLARQLGWGKETNIMTAEGNKLTGARNPLISTYDNGRPVFKDNILDFKDLDSLTAGDENITLATIKNFDMLDRLEQIDKANKSKRNLLGLFRY